MINESDRTSLEWVLNDVLAGEGVLFLGAGASKLAYLESGDALPTGQELADSLASECGIGAGYPLTDVATHFIRERSEGALITSLKKHLSVARIDDDLRSILDNPWLRIWTTNYDDACKVAHDELKLSTYSLTTADDIANSRARRRAIIHINGLLARLSHSLTPDFILSSRDYATQAFVDTDWSAVFKDDLRRAKVVVFVGYSLADVDIARLILAPVYGKAKFHFIEYEKVDPVLVSKLSDFGRVYPIGASVFAGLICEYKASWQKPSLVESYECFSKIEAATTSAQASDDQFFDLIVQGAVEDSLLAYQIDNPNDCQYVLLRDFEEDCASRLSVKGTIAIFVGSFASGKSVTLRAVALRLAGQGRDVFQLRRKNDRVDDEIIALCRREESFTLVVENLSKNLNLISAFVRNASEDCTLLLTDRAELHDLASSNLEEIAQTRPIVHFDFDRLSNNEVEHLTELMTRRGVWGARADLSQVRQKQYIVTECDRQMNAVLLDIVKAPVVIQKLSDIVCGFSEIDGGLRILITICILESIGEEPYLELLEDLLSLTYDDFRRATLNEISRQILIADSNVANFRSPLIATAVLTSMEEASVVTNILTECVVNGMKASVGNRNLNWICSSMIRFGNLERLLPKSGRLVALQNHYESVKMYFRNGRDSNFWLQYGIARISLGDLRKARLWFDNAYEHGKKSPNFDVSSVKKNIDNHYARLLLIEAQDSEDSNSAFGLVRDAMELVKGQVLNRNRHYPYRVAGGLEQPCKRHHEAWSDLQIEYILGAIDFILDSLNKLEPNLAKHRHVREGTSRLEDVRKLILRQEQADAD